MLTIFLRAFLLYLVMLVMLRGMGKHQLGQYQPYEFVMAMLIADLVSTPMSDVSTPLLHGVLPVAALFIVHGAITLVCLKFGRVRAVISGKPAQVISDGVIDRRALERLCLSLSDLNEGLRMAGIIDPAQAGTAIVECSGVVSAFPAADYRAPTTKEMNVKPPREGVPLFVVMDGKVQIDNLKKSGRDEQWLKTTLLKYNLCAGGVLLASLDRQGIMRIQDMNDAVLTIRALREDEVSW